MNMFGSTLIIAAFLSIVFILLLLWLSRWNRRSSYVSIDWPVFGMIPGLLCNLSHIHDFATFILQQNKGTFLFKGPWFFGMDFLLISDPMNVHYVLSKNFPNYPKGPEFREIFEPLGDGIFNSDSDSWSIQRRIFHSLLVKNKRFDLAVEITLRQKILNGLFPLLENVSQVDMQDVFQRFTFDNICRLVLGFDPNSLSIEFPEIAYQKAFDDIEEIIIYRHALPASIWKLQRWLQIGNEKKFKKSWKIFDDFLEQCIIRKREQVGQSCKDQMEGEGFDLLTYFLAEDNDFAKVAAESGILIKSNKFLRDMAFNLLVAGRDTIGAGLVWLFWLVGTHPFVEQKILEEIKANLGAKTSEKWRVFSIEEGRKLVYLHAVICEVLRLYPPAPFEHKVAIEEDIFPSGHNVPRNMRILFSFYAMGRMEEIWGKDCLEFKPERWISEGGRIKHVPSYKFVAFNAGPRSCIGKELAFLQMKAIAASVIWNYSLQVVENHSVSPNVSVLLYTKRGLKVRVLKRFAP
ncbi:alkane hydroxylase MAH1-like [Hevea brasiliensis]|uniref:alkane hydroxylase MAH1-like n=1 Tax=Hevea brasiliensis TaxID=3981 RepID=UPI0025E0D548|nr:alkane hydroxylase MAH1-like [Hevea brasiliensis]XP_057987707.1 alkane hydroxylase MAH1-like [Hevea brasiliensis]